MVRHCASGEFTDFEQGGNEGNEGPTKAGNVGWIEAGQGGLIRSQFQLFTGQCEAPAELCWHPPHQKSVFRRIAKLDLPLAHPPWQQWPPESLDYVRPHEVFFKPPAPAQAHLVPKLGLV